MVATLPRLIQPKSRRPFSPQSSQLTHLVAELDEKFKEFEKLLQLANTSNSAQIAAIELQNLLLENKPLLKKAGKYDIFIQQLITFCAIAGISLMLAKATPTISTTSSSIQPVRQPSIERVQAVQSLNTFFTSPSREQGAELNSTAKANRAAILKVIRFAEGTADARGYNRIFGGQEVDDLTRHPDICVKFRKTCSTAAGAYQFLTTTWEELKLGEFTPENQDKGAIALIRRRGALADVEAGRFEVAIAKLSPEWASLPRWDGDTRGTYDQPVKTMSELRRVFLEHGGQLAGKQVQATAPQLPAPIAAQKPQGLLSYFFGIQQSKAASVQQSQAQKIVNYMEKQGYEITRNPQEVNIIHVRNGDNARNKFEDKRIVLKFDASGVPQIVGEWAETAKPGLSIVRNPFKREGAFFISEGQYKAWQVGIHYGQTGRHAHEALIQVAPISGRRDSDRNTIPDTPVRGNFDVNIHAPWSDGGLVDDRSAGCLVTKTKAAHEEFMAIVKSDRRYQKNPKFVFTATIIDRGKL
jgi:muramidase (phage lysozyme)